MAHECLSLLSKNPSKKGYMTIKLDIGKAYVRLDWDFIKKCYIVLGFVINGLIGLWITTFRVLRNEKQGV